MNSNCILVDLDGTLTDVKHRRHHVNNGNKDWKAFFEGMVDDPVVEPVAEVLRAFLQYGAFRDEYGNEDAPEYAVILVTARPDNYKQETLDWLKRNEIEYDKLYMRKAGDFRSDVIVKREILAELRADGYEPLFAVDDRKEICALWREEGITCFQCAPDADFRGEVKNDHRGTLNILVGPSGGGKTSFLASKWMEFSSRGDVVIGSDTLRHQICGDYKDQSKNDLVFKTLHTLAETYIKVGVDVWVDSTALRRRDRVQLVELAKGSDVVYHVVNRPLEDKIRDAGWRADVLVKGKPLIEVHEQRFNSVIKDVMEGDGFDNVTVVDHRG